mmetsp:Transcript_6840/g.12389  ORF Transcript_6840/g.12389 Transcript_6840/m.12389 type:complete len:273 (-) Transcript_6840:139-957(-)
MHIRSRGLTSVAPARTSSLVAGRRLRRVLRSHLPPCQGARDQLAYQTGHLRRRHAHLAGGVPLAERDSVVLDGVVVDSDGEGYTQLVGARVSFADAGAGGVHNVGHFDASERSADCARAFVELWLLEEREHGGLGGRHQRAEGEDALGLVVAARVKGVLKHAVDDASQAKGGLDDGGGEGAAVLLASHPLDGHMFGLDVEGGTVDREGDGRAGLQLGTQLHRVALAHRLQRTLNRLGVLLEIAAQAALVRLHLHQLHHTGLRELLVRGEVNL